MENQQTNLISNLFHVKNENGTPNFIVWKISFHYFVCNCHCFKMTPLVKRNVETLVDICGEKAATGQSFDFYK